MRIGLSETIRKENKVVEVLLKNLSLKNRQITNCPDCGAKPELFEWFDSHNPQVRRIIIRCPGCLRTSFSRVYISHDTDVFANENNKYNAVNHVIHDWGSL